MAGPTPSHDALCDASTCHHRTWSGDPGLAFGLRLSFPADQIMALAFCARHSRAQRDRSKRTSREDELRRRDFLKAAAATSIAAPSLAAPSLVLGAENRVMKF